MARRPHNPNRPQAQQTNFQPKNTGADGEPLPPYGFVPLPLRDGQPIAVLNTPVFHDGRPGEEPRVSGELRCTLTALTPLLAANDQYETQTIRGARLEGEKVRLPDAWGITEAVAADKKVLEPLRLANGRVAIAGSALKGMLRQSLSALLAAPLERVEERSYSYRPNLQFGQGQPLREPRPAVVTGVDNGLLQVRVLPGARDAVFVCSDGLPVLKGTQVGDWVQGRFSDYEIFRERLKRAQSGGAETLDHLHLDYRGGVDGSGDLARTFDGGSVYSKVLVSRYAYENGNDAEIPSKVLAHYIISLQHLKDTKAGHLRNEHPLTSKLGTSGIKDVQDGIQQRIAEAEDPGRLRWHLIYVELEHSQSGSRIVSVGHHFRYRWRYADTVRTQGGRQRPILVPLPEEQETEKGDKHTPPLKLSGARLFFGYVSEAVQRLEMADNPGSANIGWGDFQKLAGRLAFNMAVEQINKAAKNRERFLNADRGCVVPLKVLGAPRPSAVEHYLEQTGHEALRKDASTLITYGDLPDEPGGQLRGRKFYWHQPGAASIASRKSYYQADDRDTLIGNQAALARFVSVPGSEFRFTLRFRDLRLWELGALLTALEPQHLLDGLLPHLKGKSRVGFEAMAKLKGDNPLFAHKLGHGRPLGMGSVAVQVDDLRRLTEAQTFAVDPDLAAKARAAFIARPKTFLPSNCLNWLKMHQYHDPQRLPHLDYPRAVGKDGKETIFNYHTEKRQKHAAARRTRKT